MCKFKIMVRILVKSSLLVMCIVTTLNAKLAIDPKGYILYCPCNGDFELQADQFLGALSFARALDRTLVLPPWNEYHRYKVEAIQVPFKTYFTVAAVNEFHRAITMEDFMEELAPKVWPVGKRTAYCSNYRRHDPNKISCNAKEGNPAATFWNNFDVEFDSSEVFEPDLRYDTDQVQEWNSKFPRKSHPVLAFTSSPSSFPVREANLPLQKYIQWSSEHEDRAVEYMKKNFETPFIGIHVMNSVQFKRICEHIPDLTRKKNLVASAQCLGYHNENGPVTEHLCLPSESSLIDQLKKAVEKYHAKSVFISTENDPMIQQFQNAIKGVEFVTKKKENYWEKSEQLLELAILGRADHYIGNCISLATAFVVRERRLKNKTVEFWNFTPNTHEKKDEL